MVIDQLGANDTAGEAADNQPGREHGGCHAAGRTVGERRDLSGVGDHVTSLRPLDEPRMKPV